MKILANIVFCLAIILLCYLASVGLKSLSLEYTEEELVKTKNEVTCEWRVRPRETHVFPCTMVTARIARIDL